jgi:DNA-binding MarR family transcriptional regulator
MSYVNSEKRICQLQFTWLMVQTLNDSLALANELRPVLLRLARLVRREGHALGVTAGQISLLAAIEQHPGITARELADREQISAPGMSAHLARLEEAGLIERNRAADRRRVGLSLGPEGARVLRSVRKRRTVWLADRLAHLAPEDQAAIAAAIGPLECLVGRDAG